jgi:hypothetical protein
MEQWTVQLFTLLGVTVGALASFVTTRLVDHSRWQQEETLRWDTKRLESYGDFASALMRFITIGYRITAGLGLPASVQPLDAATGLPELATAEGEVSVKWEQVLMLGAPAVITAAQERRNEAWHLEKFARGLLKDVAEYMEATQDRRAAQIRFYSVVRADLGITSGEIPFGKVTRGTTGIAGLDAEPTLNRQPSDP